MRAHTFTSTPNDRVRERDRERERVREKKYEGTMTRLDSTRLESTQRFDSIESISNPLKVITSFHLYIFIRYGTLAFGCFSPD